jgi:hypothetical protein
MMGQHPLPNSQPRWRLYFLLAALFLSIGGASIWILSLFHLLAASWANVISVIFAAVGVILALVQWLWPSPPLTSTVSPPVSPSIGTLHVKVRQQLCGTTIYADRGFHPTPSHTHLAANVIEQRNGNLMEFLAEFPDIACENYTISSTSHEPIAYITILPGRTTLIDWRYITP